MLGSSTRGGFPPYQWTPQQATLQTPLQALRGINGAPQEQRFAKSCHKNSALCSVLPFLEAHGDHLDALAKA